MPYRSSKQVQYLIDSFMLDLIGIHLAPWWSIHVKSCRFILSHNYSAEPPQEDLSDGRRWIGGCIYRAEKFCYATSLSVLLILTARPYSNTIFFKFEGKEAGL